MYLNSSLSLISSWKQSKQIAIATIKLLPDVERVSPVLVRQRSAAERDYLWKLSIFRFAIRFSKSFLLLNQFSAHRFSEWTTFLLHHIPFEIHMNRNHYSPRLLNNSQLSTLSYHLLPPKAVLSFRKGMRGPLDNRQSLINMLLPV